MSYPAGPWVPSPEAIPEELRVEDRWVRWKLVTDPNAPKPTKVPILVDSDGCAKSNDQTTWGAFDVAIANARKAPSVGVGFMLGRNGSRGYVGIDLDHVRDVETGELTPEAAEIIRRCGTYAEVSPSGRGVKLIGFVPIDAAPELPQNKADLDNGGELEVYASSRYFTVTGERLMDAPACLGEVTDGLRWLISRYLRGKATEVDMFATSEPDDVDAPEANVRRAATYLRKLAPAISGQRGHDSTWTAALAAVRGFGLSTRQAIDVLSREFNPRCSPPWPERDLARKVREVRWKASVPWGYLAGPVHELDAPKPSPCTWRPIGDVLRNARPRSPIPTGFEKLDTTFFGGGFARGEAIALGGPPGALKTTLACSLAANLAGPGVLVGFAAFDEPEERVAAKVGSRFGEAFWRLNAEYPSVLESLEERLGIKDAEIVFVDPLAGPAVEDILETFAARVPAGRTGVLVLDHLHALSTRDATEHDSEFDTIRKVASAVALQTRRLGLITVSIAEVMKAASSPEAVRANPLAAFAGTRKIASLFTVPMVAVPSEGGGMELIIAKNRLGPRGSAILDLNPETWALTVADVRTTGRSGSEENRTSATAKADDDVLRNFFADNPPMTWPNAAAALRSHGIPKDRAREARSRLVAAEELAEGEGPRPPGSRRGPIPSLWSTPEKLAESRRNSAETRQSAAFLSQEETRRASAPVRERAPSFSGRKVNREPDYDAESSRQVSCAEDGPQTASARDADHQAPPEPTRPGAASEVRTSSKRQAKR